MCSVNAADEEQRWVPTHVQVLVIRARGLRAKGKHGTSDAYALIQLGKEKYSTCVIEKSTEPEWGEECSFELQPGLLEVGGRDACPPGSCDLTVTVMHRALIGLDVFLGQAVIPLDKAFHERRCMKNEWCKLHSKTGKKEKERGELQITVQFTRHNLTASMYDLSIKDKPRSAFGKLRERMRAKKRCGDEESSSAIVPGGYGALARMRGRLPSDGGGEEDYEDDEGGELRRSKMRSFFLRGRLRKSSDTRSSTSLGSESSESSSRGGSLSPTAGISVVVSDLSNSPSNSSNLTADNSPEHTVAPSPQVSPVRLMFDDEPCDISIPVPQSLTNDNDAIILLPSVCVNGNPVETSPLTHQPPSLILQQPKPQTQQEPSKLIQAQKANILEPKPQSSPEPKSQPTKAESKSRPEPQLPALGLLQKSSALSLSLQNLSRRGEERQSGGPIDGRRWSFDKPGEEEKAAIAAALVHAGLVPDEPETETTISETEVQSKKKRGLFSHGRGGESAGKGSGSGKEETSHGQQPSEGKHRGWFSSKDSKPSQLSAHQADSSSSTTMVLSPLAPSYLSQGMTQQHTNPFTSPPLLSHANPFFSLMQKNPFFQELCTLNSLTPTIPSLFSPAHRQPETPPSGTRILTHLPALDKVDGASEMGTNPNKTDISDDPLVNLSISQSEKYSDWDDFIDDRLKPSENLRNEMLNLPFVLVEPPDLFPFCDEGSRTVSMGDSLVNVAQACTLIADGLNPSNTLTDTLGSKRISICGNTCNTDLSSLAAQESLQCDFDSSIPQNSSMEFSELNKLACPFPALSRGCGNQDKESAILDAEHFVETPQVICSSSSSAFSTSFGSPEFPALGDELLDPLAHTVDNLMLTSDETVKSVETRKTKIPCTKYPGSDDILEPIMTGLPLSSDLPDLQVAKSSQTGLSDFRSHDVELKESFIKDMAHLDGSLLTHAATDLSNRLGTSECTLNTRMVIKEKDASGKVGCFFIDRNEVRLVGEGSLINDMKIILTSSPSVSSSMPLEKEEIYDCQHDPSKGNFKVDVFSGSQREHPEVETCGSKKILSEGCLHPLGASGSTGTEPVALNLNVALYPSLLFHSLYTSANSEQYLTCSSLQDSLSMSKLSQEYKPNHGPFLKDEQKCVSSRVISQSSMTEVQYDQNRPEIFEEPIYDTSNPQAFHTIMLKDAASQNASVTCENIEASIPFAFINEPKRKCYLSVDAMLNHDLLQEETLPKGVTTQKMLARPEEDFVKFDPQTCSTYAQQNEAFCQPAGNIHGSDSPFEPVSTITQDIVKSDLLLENIFVPQPAATHTVDTNPIQHPTSIETGSNVALHPECTETSNKKFKMQTETSDDLNITSPYLESLRPWPSTARSLSLDQLTLPSGCDHNLNSPLSLPDLSPIASSTPHVAADTNAIPLYPFPVISFNPAHSSPSTVQAASLLPTFPQETHQVPSHLSSPHPVKPLTPPDEKRSEGRSVLEKLKSTIHPGRSHHGDQESEKKLLVEGGGSYYHLNHSELVSLLLKRDAVLQQEREEYERRGVLLEKREVEIKKMKVLIRDLEDYIDTLLVRIMEQTPTLLQVRPRMK